VDSVPDPLLLKNSGNAENRARTCEFVARNFDHYTIEAVFNSNNNNNNNNNNNIWAMYSMKILGLSFTVS
jgi:hypothetical protein